MSNRGFLYFCSALFTIWIISFGFDELKRQNRDQKAVESDIYIEIPAPKTINPNRKITWEVGGFSFTKL